MFEGRRRFRGLAAAAALLFSLYLAAAVAVELGWLATAAETSGDSSLTPPSLAHWLGTDLLGRDLLQRVVQAAALAVEVGLAANLVAISVGFILGAAAGLAGGFIDAAVVWLYSVLDNIPGFLLVLALSYLFGHGLTAVCLAVGLTSWVPLCRQVRSECRQERRAAYLESAQLAGASWPRRVLVHLLPNLCPLLWADFAARFAYAVKAELILSYLGIGVSDRPSWGRIIAESQSQILAGAWWPLVGTSLAAFGLVLSVSLLAGRETPEEQLP